MENFKEVFQDKRIVGIAIPMVTRDFLSVEEMIEIHNEVDKEKGAVYFSTSNRIAQGDKVDYALFYNRTNYYLAKIVDYVKFSKEDIPEDSLDYSPKDYADIPMKHWFKVTEICNLSSKELHELSLMLCNKEAQGVYKGVAQYIETSKRLQIFYWKNK